MKFVMIESKVFMMKENSNFVHIVHPFSPFFKEDSQILILGSFPSVKSREDGFYYGNPQNRFWKMLSIIYEENVPKSIDDKKDFLARHKIALYDSIKECSISGSADSSIKNVVPSDIKSILENSTIEKILANGKTTAKFFEKYQDSELRRKLFTMPSTSPANASFSLEKLVSIWKKELLSF